MDTQALVVDIASITAALEAQDLGVVVDHPIAGHPQVAHLLIAREVEAYTVVITSPEGNAVRPQEIDPGVPDLLAAAFPTAVGHLPLERTAALLHGYCSEAALAKLQEDQVIQWACGISEPGYLWGPKGVLLANWNPIDEAFQAWLETQGYTLHWEDEWTFCQDCQKIFRTVSDCYSWQRYGYTDAEGFDHCGECVLKAPTDYLSAHDGSARKAITIQAVDPAAHHYLKVNVEQFESGLHPGHTDDPKATAALLRSNGVTRFLFKLTKTGQFSVFYDLYIHEDHATALATVRALLAQEA